METEIIYFKNKLLEEKVLLEKELSSVGRVNSNNPNDWEGKQDELNIQEADRNESADRIEDYETNSAIEVELENRLLEINDALKRIENNSYGVCEIGGEKIEKDRLEANPAAKTCKTHIGTRL